jgi:O-antigen/teichoic acid export membrane protein
MVLISYISDLGLSYTLIRVLPTSDDPDSEINVALVLTTGMALVISACYLLVIPSLVPRLDFLRQNTLDAIGFVLLNGCASANLLTDSVFIARRQSQYNLLVDGIFQGVTKLVCLVGFVGLSAYGIFLANGIGGAIAVVASLIFMVWRLGYRPRLKVDLAVFVRNMRFSLTNYVASVFQLLPQLLLPIIVLSDEGARHAAYFFIAFNLANLTYGVPFAMGVSLFAEGSQGTMDVRALARRAARLLGPVTLAMAVIIAGAAHWILFIFGSNYSRNAAPTLVVMVAALPIVAFNNIGQVLLKLQGRLNTLVFVNFASFVVILGLAEAWGAKNLPLVGLAWLLGNLIAALLALAGWLLPRKAADR